MYAKKGLEFPVVAMVGVDHMPTEGEEVKLFFVGATRVAQRLIVGLGGSGRFGQRHTA